MPVSKEERVKRGLVGKKVYYNSDGVKIEVDWDDEDNILLSKEDVLNCESFNKKGRSIKMLSDGTEEIIENEFIEVE